ncbi:hypothetical protein C8R44DRAFT_875876 [Mycena epipterygia]|nr:hypothetical protein C8R44DRAFT_875876 [Mycena epipterygia]
MSGRFSPMTAPLLPPHRCALRLLQPSPPAPAVFPSLPLSLEARAPSPLQLLRPSLLLLLPTPPFPLPFLSSAHDQTTNLPTTPGIGLCVSARNHRFFLNFAFATLAFTSYTFALLIAFNVPAAVLFTASLGAAHMRLILLSQTTVESLGVQQIKERGREGLEEARARCWEVGYGECT